MKTIILLLTVSTLLFAQGDIEKGIQLQKEKKYIEAKAIFEKVLKNEPNNAEANLRLGQLYLNIFKDTDKAIEYFEKSVEINDKSSDYHYWLGTGYGIKASNSNMFTAMRMAPKMKSEMEKAIELNAKNLEARQALFQYLMQAPSIIGGGIDKAKALAQETIKLDEATGRGMMARIYAKEEKFELADEEVKKVVALSKSTINSKIGDLYNEFGYFYIRMKRYDDAIHQFKKYIEVEPDNPNGHDSLGDGYFAKGLYDEAIAEYKKAVQMDPNFTASIYNLGHAYEKKGLKDEALKYYNQCVNLNSNDRFAKKAKEKIKELN
jgi:tetratricopeptide (TPR) repeat protein